MTEPRRGGPKQMEDEALRDFLTQPRWACLCIQDATGALRAAPAWVQSATEDEVVVSLPDGADLPDRDRADACLVADEFADYVGIRGAIVRGVLHPSGGDGTDRRARRLSITRARGFSFEGTTVSL